MPRDLSAVLLAPVLCPELGCSVLGMEEAVATHDANHRPQGTQYGPGDYVLGDGSSNKACMGMVTGLLLCTHLAKGTEAWGAPALSLWTLEPTLPVRDSWKDCAF